MADLWPWLAIAGLGALHGSSPATGWMFAAAWGLREGEQARAAPVWRALLPMAIGHAASVAAVALAVTQGLVMDRGAAQGLAGALLVGAAAYRGLHGRGTCAPLGTRAGHTGMALWACLLSFLTATAHGAGLMLVPALVPLCLADNPAREITASGSLLLAAAAVGVHTAAMLATTGVIATGVCRGVALLPRLSNGCARRRVWTAALAVTGVVLIVLR